MRGPILFVLCLVTAATLTALAVRPAPGDAEGEARGDEPEPFAFFAGIREAAAERDVESVDARGVVPMAAQACALPGSCQVMVGAQRESLPVVERAGLARLDLRVEWRAASPATQRLVAELLACRAPCSQDAAVLASATGASPLVLAYEAPRGEEAAGHSLRVRLVDAVAGPPEAYASPSDQPFAVAGSAEFR